MARGRLSAFDAESLRFAFPAQFLPAEFNGLSTVRTSHDLEIRRTKTIRRAWIDRPCGVLRYRVGV